MEKTVDADAAVGTDKNRCVTMNMPYSEHLPCVLYK